jgi:hypothetical protein
VPRFGVEKCLINAVVPAPNNVVVATEFRCDRVRQRYFVAATAWSHDTSRAFCPAIPTENPDGPEVNRAVAKLLEKLDYGRSII